MPVILGLGYDTYVILILCHVIYDTHVTYDTYFAA